ncbi:MFS family permease [Paenibacillus shirakamiensis]|uniref:MFS family permease n=1 Tax=Paenibacillus shirakamiensis TaxID=1265935 RepID=A0ABS4JG35_9BACL|nr:SLC45 family MFS transporter [Paenibacillus shirakamiensis]MBP2000685.1 MFS family permease [Paenibacillus shirakamiensis]
MTKKTWLLGLGFFSISITWALYNAFVPLFLAQYLQKASLIGFMMTIDNYLALFIQPWIGHRSDRTNTRFGRRMPYLLMGMPLAALFVTLIPWYTSLSTLVIFMVLMNLSMSLFRSPTVSLMPDITPEPQRTKANGIINVMGGLGSVLAFGVGSILYKIGTFVPFLCAGVIIIGAMLILKFGIKEVPNPIANKDVHAFSKPRISLRAQLDRTTILILSAIFCWFLAYQGVEAMFTLYGTKYLGLSGSAASFSLTFFSLAFLAFAIPSGWLGARYGKKRVILSGVVGLFIIFSAIVFVHHLLALRLLLVAGGLFWACININSYPWIVSTGSEESIGTRTGLYYLVSSLAAIISPPLLGLLMDQWGYPALFITASVGLLLALLCLLPIPSELSRTEGDPTVTNVRL